MLKISSSRNKTDLGEGEAPEDPEINRLADLFRWLAKKVSAVRKQIAALHKSNLGNIEFSRQVGESFRSIGRVLEKMTDDPDSILLGHVMLQIGEFTREHEDNHYKVDQDVSSALDKPITEYLLDLKRAKKEKQEYEKKRTAYINSKVKAAKEKAAKKPSTLKIAEAEAEEAVNKSLYFDCAKDTLESYHKLMDKNQQRLLTFLNEEFINGMQEYLQTALEGVQSLITTLDLPPEVIEEASKRNKVEEKNRKRTDVLKEMVQHEKAYIEVLESIMAAKDTLDSGLQTEPKLAEKVTRNDAYMMFSEIKPILTWHVEMLDALNEAVKAYPNDNLGKKLVDGMDRWKWYLTFAEHSGSGSDIFLKRRTESKIFKKLVRKDLPNLLDRPLTRISEWVSFLKELLDHTNKSEAAHAGLLSAWDLLRRLNDGPLAETKAKAKQLKDLLRVSNLLIGYDGKLIEAHRRLLRETVMEIIHPYVIVEGDPNPKDNVGKVRVEYVLYFFNDFLLYGTPIKHQVKYVGKFNLSQVAITPLNDEAELYNAAKLVLEPSGEGDSGVRTFRENSETHTLIFPTQQQKNKWIPALQEAIHTLKTAQVFGLTLTDLMQNNPKEAGRTIPRVLEFTYDFLTTRSLCVQGLFRESGSASIIKEYKAIIDVGGNLVLPHNENDHNISGILKAFIRDLPDPLFTFAMYDTWIKIGTQIDEEIASGGVKEGYKKLKETVLVLPEANKYFLQVLMKLLHQVADPKNAEKNMMKSSNIVIVFAPILLYKKDASPFDTGDFKNINLIIDGMINFYDIIFGDIEKERLAKEGK